jgi:hypothetical protein
MPQTTPAVLPIVCMAFSEGHGDMTELYVERLSGMLRRHVRRPYQLYCYTDRDCRLPAGVVRRDCSGWTELERKGMRATTRKLGLFNPDYVEFDEFLYLDLSLVIRRDMGDLLDYAFGRAEDLVIVPHWYHACYNSSVMRIRSGPLRAVYDRFVAGDSFVQRVPGDQDFVHGVVGKLGLGERVALFPAHQVVSFKKTMKAGRHDAEGGRERIASATIVKFHGQPKMDEAFGHRYGLLKVRLRELLRGHWKPVMPLAELRRHWTGEAAR